MQTKFGVIGCRRGRSFMRVCAAVGGATVAAIYDVDRERADAAAYEHDRRRLDDALANPLRTLLVLLLLAVAPALAVIALVWRLWGRERGTGYDREYEQEPPTETQPALVPSLLAQGGAAGSLEFTATLFDLIRRGR